MKVIVLHPGRAMMAGLLSALLVGASVLGALAIAGVFSSDAAEAYGATGVGAKMWYFAEGYTGTGFEEWILIYNPPDVLPGGGDAGGSGEAIHPAIHMYGNNGFIGSITGLSVAPGQRISFDITTAALSHGYSGDISILVEADYPFISERAMYWEYKGKWTGGCSVPGYQEGPAE